MPAAYVPPEPAPRMAPGPPPTGPEPALPTVPAPAAHPIGVEARWVPLASGGATALEGASTRSGAFLMAATRAEPDGHRAARERSAAEFGTRSALLSCVEALLPELEPGWSTCTEHAGCRAVQEAATVLWASGPRDPAPTGERERAPPENGPSSSAPPAAASLPGVPDRLIRPDAPAEPGP